MGVILAVAIFGMLLDIRVCSVFENRPVVSTKCGKYIGIYENVGFNEVAVFRGIPYARPPIRNLRFKMPVSVPCNVEQEYDASINGPACPQEESNYPWVDNESKKNEDCLYLNIWVPSSHNCNYAVMFWIHPGFFTFGSNSIDICDGKVLADLGNIIVVAINHRLGPLGFGYADSSDIPGNMGLHDVLLALQWTYDNIQHFGGDNQQITLSGYSAGSMTTSLFSISELSRHLFRRIIVQGGAVGPAVPVHPHFNFNRTLSIAKHVICAPESSFAFNDEIIQCLAKINPTSLINADRNINGYYSPQYMEKFFPIHPLKMMKRGNFKSVELLVGDVKDEGTYFIPLKAPEEYGSFGEKKSITNKTFGRELVKRVLYNIPRNEEIIDYYYGKVRDEDYCGIINQTGRIFQDLRYLCPDENFAIRMAETNNVYLYYFIHRRSTSPWAEWMGAVHFDEVPFQFGHPLRYPKLYTPEEVRLSYKIVKMWTNFVKTGYPGLPYEPWPLYSKNSKKYLIFDTGDHVPIGYDGPEIKNCLFLNHLLEM